MLGVSAEGAGLTKENFIVYASTPMSCLVEKNKLCRERLAVTLLLSAGLK